MLPATRIFFNLFCQGDLSCVLLKKSLGYIFILITNMVCFVNRNGMMCFSPSSICGVMIAQDFGDMFQYR